MKVAKFVMSRASPEMPSSNSPTTRMANRRSISTSAAASSASIASQNRRWSVAAAGSRSRRSPAVPAHQSAKASFDRGATTLFAQANAR